MSDMNYPYPISIELINKAIGINDNNVAIRLFEYFTNFVIIVTSMSFNYESDPNPDNITFDEYLDIHKCTCNDCSRLGSLLTETYRNVNEVCQTIEKYKNMGINAPEDIFDDTFRLLYEIYKKDEDVNSKLISTANLNLN